MASPPEPLTGREFASRGPRFFATSADQPRARRATDVIGLVAATAALVVITLFASPQPGFARAVVDLLTSLPPLLTAVWQIGSDLLVVQAALILVVCAVRRRWSIARDLVLAGLAAIAVIVVTSWMLDGEWPELARTLLRAEPPPIYPWTRLAVPVAVIMAAGPHVALPVRRIGRWSTSLATLAGIALGAATVLGSIAALLAGLIAASAVHLVFGSSAGRPSLDEVEAALTELGVAAHDLHVAEAQRAGVFTVTATGQLGDRWLAPSPPTSPEVPVPLKVKVYGRDAHGTAIVSALWRTVWFRDPAPPNGFGRLQQVEHEAFVTLLARQARVRTDQVVTAGATDSDDALLVLRSVGQPLPDDDVDAVRDLWLMVDALHRAGIAHGQIDAEHLVVDEGGLGIIDLRTARVAPTAIQLRTDEVQALVTQALRLGIDEALACVLQARGTSGVAAMLPLVQEATLTRRQRDEAKQVELDLDDLRTQAASLAGVEEPAQLRLYRFSVGSVLRIAFPVIALFAFVAALSGVDFEALGREISGATWWLVAIGALLAQAPRLFQAVSTLGASPIPLPLGPVYALQLAVSYVNLAIPTSAARMAVNIRFFQRHGVPPGAALAAGALDGFSGFLMQLLLLAAFVIATPLSLDLGLVVPGAGTATTLALAALAIGLAAVVLLVAVGRLRRFLVHWAKQLTSEALTVARGLRSPRRLAMLFGGNLAAELLFALALGAFVRAFGASVGLGELLLIIIAVSLLAGLLPVPGGIGVTEGGLIYGLVAAGVNEEVAFASVISYRLATFYLPPIWGFFSLRWLERHRHL